MRLRCLAVALALLAASASASASARTKKDQTQPQEQKTAPDQRGTEQLPFIVQPLPTKKSVAIAEQEKRDTNEKRDSDWWTWLLGVLTIVALFGQLAVFVAQAYYLKCTLRATATAANAAELSAKAAIALELPSIQANAAKLASQPDVKQDTTGKQHYVCSVNELQFANRGRTKASLIEVQFGLTISDILPKIPVYRYTKPFPFNRILGSDTKILEDVFLHQYDFEAPADLYDQLRNKKTNLWFYCSLVYIDFVEVRHEACFCWKQHETTGMGTLRPDATPAYNRKT